MADFLMEVTAKTMADIKGGTLVQYKDRLRLLEVAQVNSIVIAQWFSCEEPSNK